MNKEPDWNVFIDSIYDLQEKLIQLITNVLWELEYPLPHVQPGSIYNIWSQHKTDVDKVLQTVIDDDDEWEVLWLKKATQQIIHTLNHSTSLYFEIIFYHRSYTDNWNIHTQQLIPNTNHLVSILTNDVRRSMTGDYPMHFHMPYMTCIHKLVRRRFVCWVQPCKTIVHCLSLKELQEVKIAFAMITNKGLTQHSVDLDSDLLAFIFTFVTNQSYWEYRAVDD